MLITYALQLASPELRGDREVLFEVVRQSAYICLGVRDTNAFPSFKTLQLTRRNVPQSAPVYRCEIRIQGLESLRFLKLHMYLKQPEILLCNQVHM